MSEDIKDVELEEEKEEQEEEQEEKQEDEQEESNKDDKKKSKSGKMFSQEQLNRMMTREKNQGRNAVYRELGINPKDSKAIAMVKALIESQKTDEEKQKEKEDEATQKMNEAEQRAQLAEAKAEAMMLGVKTQYVEDVVTLALAKMTEDSDLKTIIGEFKTKYPVWFGESEEDDKQKDKKQKTGQKGTGSSVKTSKKDEKNNEEKGLGARLAAQRKGGSKKFSYWGNNK